MFVKSEHHTREQEEKMKFESQIFVITPRFKENWSCPVVTIKSVTNATALDSLLLYRHCHKFQKQLPLTLQPYVLRTPAGTVFT
jgi:hypothetical protein